MLLNIPELLSADTVRTLRESLAHARWSDGRDSAGSQARQVKNNQQLAHDDAIALQVRQAVLAAMERSTLLLTAALPKRVFTPRVNRYSGTANQYGPHVDNAIRTLAQPGPQLGQRVRTDISCTVFLSDPDRYEGGELCITDTFGEQRIKLPAGDAVIYPGTSVHQVLPVTRGERLACFFWIESLVRSDEQRRLLFDMDMALLSLRTQHGESPQTTALTSTYHNLLRLWADT
ncbi:MAG: Fe2+-dependent dioxygenase [Burkholderiaceae bacterium]|nr:Fe2+-dependent dioxygenase [Burkholderiaceae bacterium]